MDARTELAALIERFTGSDGMHETALARVGLIRASTPTEPLLALHEPAVCLIVQGRKQVLVGDAVHIYDREKYLIVSVDVPVIGQVIEATPEAPYLCLRLDIDPAMAGALVMDAGLAKARREPVGGVAVSPVTPGLLDAALRLVALLDSPDDAAILAPLVEREILYRLLTGDQGARMAQIAMADNRLQQVNRAISWIKQNYSRPFSVDSVASEAGMSASALHQHFKTVTAMSPLQYQKQLRLQEARRLIVAQNMDAASAGHAVGYDSPSQFSREYSRVFGAPPLRDAARFRAAPGMLTPA
ncbi:AraC family transcriptional regulator [Caulobacter segnis]|uniref:AraC family transcriptional regulator n=1 Tax=Caulobacter segnis TaxID=88688 RepID=UPI00240F5B30|nr:AraC family transcriptional regulator [Caulobacter segnis]MDG2521879.1 AraC family transcriptional regulator [Caulobacter segnis]